MLVTFYSDTGVAYTVKTDSSGYFVFDFKKTPLYGYPIKVTGNDYANMYIPWPYNNPPQSFKMISMNDLEVVLIKGTCKGESETEIAAMSLFIKTFLYIHL